MKDFLKKFLRSSQDGAYTIPKNEKQISREDLEAKAIRGAEKALKEYKRVFERLAEYDRV